MNPVSHRCEWNHWDRPGRCLEDARVYVVVFKDGRRADKHLCDEAAGECGASHAVADVLECSQSDASVKP